MMRRHRAFTLTELLVGTLVIAITAGVFVLNTDTFGKQTAQREAERAAAYLQTYIRRADMTQDTLWIAVTPAKIELKTGNFTEKSAYENAGYAAYPFEVSAGCTFQDTHTFVYPRNEDVYWSSVKFLHIPSWSGVSPGSGTSAMYCITVNGADGKTYNVLIGE